MSNNAVAAITAIAEAINNNKQLLTELDAAIGDADHGINMSRGFEAVLAKIQTMSQNPDIGALLKTVGMTLVSTVGGASGPLYGTAFLRAGASAQGLSSIDSQAAVQMLEAAIRGIKDRGKAVHGEKTMLDALEPAYEAFANCANMQKPLADCLAMACEAALKGVEFTKTIVATKGRASYLGERSLGHQDPGATSSYLMLKALADFCCLNNLGGK